MCSFTAPTWISGNLLLEYSLWEPSFHVVMCPSHVEGWQPQVTSQIPARTNCWPYEWAIWASNWEELSWLYLLPTLTATFWASPGENYPVEPNQPAELWGIIKHYCPKPLNFQGDLLHTVDNRNTSNHLKLSCETKPRQALGQWPQWHVSIPLVGPRDQGVTPSKPKEMISGLLVNPGPRRAHWRWGDHLSINSTSLAVGLQFGNISANQARSILALMGSFWTQACRTVHFIWLVLAECPSSWDWMSVPCRVSSKWLMKMPKRTEPVKSHRRCCFPLGPLWLLFCQLRIHQFVLVSAQSSPSDPPFHEVLNRDSDTPSSRGLGRLSRRKGYIFGGSYSTHGVSRPSPLFPLYTNILQSPSSTMAWLYGM